jgi:very-short-patch-repair endonuclease/gamma-glutamylcyclotransferase (GGCT)/AIG2-like uncharacterized protein YtfP
VRVPKDHSHRLKKFARQLRAASTDAERLLWSRLRDRQLEGFKFRRQVPIHGYIVDFYCEKAKVAIELDGGQHTEPTHQHADNARDAQLMSLGIRTLRFSDVEMMREMNAVLNAILDACMAPSPLPSPAAPGEGDDLILFVYGTLIPGLEPPSMSHIVQQMAVLGDATVGGTLYDLGRYPGIALDTGNTIRGKLVQLASAEHWRALDAYEGCPRPEAEGALFQRVRCIAHTLDGRETPCWVYIYARDLSRAKAVEHGCWLTHRSGHKMMRA